ncbi:MAG: hypothetical protein FVQ80_00440 [Planctomycetes bacterium]|nr:hypothetical protein [Planctomycetota bacterium]
MKKIIWNNHLTLVLIFRIARRFGLQNIKSINFATCSCLARCLTTFWNIFYIGRDKLFLKIPGNPISGPRLNFAEIYSKDGHLVYDDIMSSVLQLRREITEDVFSDKKLNVTELYPHAASRPSLRSFFEMQIGKDINTALCFAHYIRYRKDETNDDVLVLTWLDWSKHVKPYIKNMGIDVWEIKSGWLVELTLIVQVFLMFLLNITLTFKQFLISKLFSDSSAEEDRSRAIDKNLPKILAPYTMSILSYKRNCLPWLWDSELAKEKIVVLLSFNAVITKEEKDVAKSMGITLLREARCRKWLASFRNRSKCPSSSNEPLVWEPSGKYPGILFELLRDIGTIIKKTLFSTNRVMLRQLYIFMKAAYRIAYYKDFVLTNNIAVDINSEDSENVFLRALAMEECGGIMVSWERSIRFEYSHFLHNKYVHVEFVTGDYSLMALNEESNSKYIFKSGWINGSMLKDSEKEAELLRESLSISDKCLCIALFDEMWGDHILSRANVEGLYRALLKATLKNENYKLIIKSKKPHVIAAMSAEIHDLIKDAEKLGRCRILDTLQNVSTAALASNISVSLPSMAAFESILSGSRTVLFNYKKRNSDLFCQDDNFSNIIFEDLDELTASIDEFSRGLKPNLGDCSALLQKISPFQDNKAGERVGNYLSWFIEALNNGMDRDSALAMANDRFASMYDACVGSSTN